MFAEVVVDRESLHHYWPQQMDVLVVAAAAVGRVRTSLLTSTVFYDEDF